MKNTLIGIAGISLIFNAILIYVFVFKGETHHSIDDRTELSVTSSNRDFVLLEMREFLESVQQINEGILNNNAEIIITAAKKSGGSVIAHAPNGLLKSLPVGFKKLGFATHEIFDEIAKNAENNFEPKQIQTQLNQLLNNCTACHKAYKISTISLK